MSTHLGVAIAWSLLGTCLGFLVFNFPPAKIYMGDSGSTTLGFTLAFLALDAYRAAAPVHPLPLFPIIFAALPLLDAAFAILRRLYRGCSPLIGDRFHFYDLLLARGWAQRRVSLTCYTITGVLVATGWWSMRLGSAQALMILAICFVALAGAGLRLGSLTSSTPNLAMQKDNTATFSENVQSSVASLTVVEK